MTMISVGRAPSAMHVFLLNEDVSLLLLSDWLGFGSIGALDVAITNRTTRVLWLQRVRSVSEGDVINWQHSHSSVRWLVMRSLRISSMRMKREYR